jgi:two-component system, NarL family, sensor histidine kinase UhpB
VEEAHVTLGFPKVGVEGWDAESQTPVAASVEADPGHLARELHDVVAQPLVSLVLEIHELGVRIGSDEEAAKSLARLEASARAVLRNTRELLVDLRGLGDIRLNFREMLENELLRNSPHWGGVLPLLQSSSSWPPQISGWAAFNLLRIVQEAVANAARHGHATRIDIILGASAEQEAVVVVLDDGAGLGDAPSGIGIVGMQERAVILGGKFTACARWSGGTRIEVRVPLHRLS